MKFQRSKLHIRLLLLSCSSILQLSSSSSSSSSSPTSTPTSSPVVTTQTKVEKEEVTKKCFPYGCPLLPQDVAFDSDVTEALGVIRPICNNEDSTATKSSSSSSEQVSVSSTLQSSGRNNAATLTLIGYKGGPIETQINQDRAFVLNPFYFLPEEEEERNSSEEQAQMLGVFDGHGRLGEVVSEYAVTTLPQLLSTKLGDIFKHKDENKEEEEEVIQRAISESFLEIDETIPTAGVGGCTASVVLHIPSSSSSSSKIYIANAGDSRSFIATHYKSTSQSYTNIIYATREDKAHLSEERTRIEQNGGTILTYDDDENDSRVLYTKGKYQMSLAMSRSIGDWEFGEIGVIAKPIVDSLIVEDVVRKEVERLRLLLQEEDGMACVDDGEEEEEDGEEKTCQVIEEQDVRVFAVSATDGLLDYIAPDVLMSTIAASLFRDDDEPSLCLFSSMEKLIYSAAKGWHDEMDGEYRDDIAVAASIIR